ncbi:MAG: chitobiase/beta-hexosaminidase C-terminal domain-containing protein [Prevotellaceae bacterium]|nr:chitobiase/beta-hexosaminidase C-terminal domain-containing protein [Prevotellaceae bacterium]
MKKILFLILVFCGLTSANIYAEETFNATLAHIISVQGGSNEPGVFLDQDTHYYNNWGDQAWAGQAYTYYTFEIPEGTVVSKATFTFNIKAGSKTKRLTSINYLPADFSIDFDNPDALTLSPEIGTNLVTYNDLTTTAVTRSIDVTEAVIELSKQGHIYFVFANANAGGYLAGIGNENAPTLEITVTRNKFGYIYTGEPSAVKDQLLALGTNDIELINIAESKPDTATLRKYDFIAIDPELEANEENADYLKSVIPWVPTLNFNAAMYSPWGYGAEKEALSEVAVIRDDYAGLTKNITIDEEINGFPLTNETMPVGVELAGNFANDPVWLVDLEDSTVVFSHSHNMDHNGYLYLPYTAESIVDIPEESAAILENAINIVKNSKQDITPTPAPQIIVGNGNRMATIAFYDDVVNAAIYYTIDGTEPTLESTLYTEPFTVTTDCTIKAIALGEGYLLSATSSADVVMLDQLPVPSINVLELGEGNATLVTFDPNVEPVDGEEITVYYNYTGERDITVSSVYNEPVQIFYTPEPKTIYAFTTSSLRVTSEAAKATVKANVTTPRRKVLTHMNASSADWNAGSTSTNYFFSWRKSARSMYIEDVDPETGEIVKMLNTPETQGPKLAEGAEIQDSLNADWQLKSYGQVMDWLKMSATYDLANSAAYNAWLVDDIDNSDGLLTSGCIQFGGKADGESANASIETVKAFQAPFNVFVIVGNGQKPSETSSIVSQHTFEIAVSTDTTDVDGWDTVDCIMTPNVGRNWTRVERAYNGTDKVFVRVKQVAGGSSAYITDIYLFGASEPAGLKGDANEDGTVDVSDITTIASYILGSTPSPFNLNNADVDGDGEITVSDITATASIILGK